MEVINNSEVKINESDLMTWVDKVCSELKAKNIQVQQLNKNLTLAFVNEQDIQKLNKTFRKKDTVTDILSFAPVEKDSLGEIALCLPFMYRTKPDGFSNKEWLYYLILHGMLHLFGFEHEKKLAEAQKMYRIQDTIFKDLMGISDLD